MSIPQLLHEKSKSIQLRPTVAEGRRVHFLKDGEFMEEAWLTLRSSGADLEPVKRIPAGGGKGGGIIFAEGRNENILMLSSELIDDEADALLSIVQCTADLSALPVAAGRSSSMSWRCVRRPIG